ncbi:hypothetical protein [Bacillus ndiopicus]|uniref:hypothetical protein n=1 Tax=Bacillus ndiopicus TaxID=1347368 RepID=UPI0005AB7755|nr:hypothetical protein [Bacillus ndiopicus]
MKKLFALFAFITILVGCQAKDEMAVTLPDEMPTDFNFKVQFGIGTKNIIDTYENTVTKDLISDGTASTPFQFTEEEMTFIYNEMKESDVGATKKLIPKSNCGMEPYSEDIWHITINGQTIDYELTDRYCKLTKDAEELLALREKIFSIVRSKPEYQDLPEPRGGYE